MTKETILFWCDLETTGLDEQTGRILEYAVVFTNLELNQLSAMQSIVKQNVEEARALMDEYVVNMHTQNGLLDEIAAAGSSACADYKNTIKLWDTVIAGTMRDVGRRVSDDVIFVIAGSTVGFDKSYIKKHMPTVYKQLHYRQLDVSSYKVGFPEIFGTATSDAHRAMADIRASIEQHRKMRDLVEDAWKYEQASK